MIITISATLTPEWVDILAKTKGYSDEVPNGPGMPTIANPQSKEDFIRQIYKSMIENDAADVFIKYDKYQRADQERIIEETIRANVTASITSSIE